MIVLGEFNHFQPNKRQKEWLTSTNLVVLLHTYSKQHFPNKMRFQVTQIEFDFTTDDGEYELQPSKQEQIIDDTLGHIWEADDEDDLIEEITCATGWCIKSIDYRIVLK